MSVVSMYVEAAGPCCVRNPRISRCVPLLSPDVAHGLCMGFEYDFNVFASSFFIFLIFLTIEFGMRFFIIPLFWHRFFFYACACGRFIHFVWYFRFVLVNMHVLRNKCG